VLEDAEEVAGACGAAATSAVWGTPSLWPVPAAATV
jgi:hypothetical protein